MKIRLLVNEKEREKLNKDLESLGYVIDDIDYDYTLVSNQSIDKITGYKDKEIFLIDPEDVLYFESFGNEIICHTNAVICKVKYKLYEIENLFAEKQYMRVSNSYIVNLNQIKSIKPTFNSKFILTMKNNDKVDVTRSYYALFKNYIEGGRK
jgi:DNA-binding LytR/AlgR family response regulator